MSGKEYVSREAHERIYSMYIKAVQDLQLANSRIVALNGAPVLESATVVKNAGPELMGRVSVGVVVCPGCGLKMEVMK